MVFTHRNLVGEGRNLHLVSVQAFLSPACQPMKIRFSTPSCISPTLWRPQTPTCSKAVILQSPTLKASLCSPPSLNIDHHGHPGSGSQDHSGGDRVHRKGKRRTALNAQRPHRALRPDLLPYSSWNVCSRDEGCSQSTQRCNMRGANL